MEESTKPCEIKIKTYIVWSFLRRTHNSGQNRVITKTYVYRVSAAGNGRVVGGERRRRYTSERKRKFKFQNETTADEPDGERERTAKNKNTQT